MYQIPKGIVGLHNITAEELIKVYTFRMAKKGVPGRSFYDKIIASPVHGKCPLCGHRIVSTIDHYLPKAIYPVFSVTPINLIPACWDCNKIKETCVPSVNTEETLHPYFDNVESELWLKARVIETHPCSIEFYIEKPDSWDNILEQRVKYHFKTLKLSELYSLQSAEELININYQLNNLFDKGGKESVKSLLSETAESRFRVCKNSWQTAMYMGIANSEWFCDGGFIL